MDKPKMIMMCGLVGSGKSTYAEKLSEKYNANIHASDKIREELGDINDQSHNNKVFQILHTRIKGDLINGKNCIYDATNINYKKRMAFLQELNKIPCEKICVFMATPYEECLKNNENRDRKVPQYVVERMYRHFDVPYYYEGWNHIEVVYANEKYKDYYGTIVDFLVRYETYNQDNSHHQLTLGRHCIEAFRYATNADGFIFGFTPIRATALHDCGKPFCKTFKNSKGEVTKQAHYYDHEKVGSYNSFFYSTHTMNPLGIAVLIRWHMQLYFIKDNEKALNKYKTLWGENLYNELQLLHRADVNAH